MSHDLDQEKARQQTFTWARSLEFKRYNALLGEYQVRSCLEYARGRSVLDLACGDGVTTALFAQKFQRVVGVDASVTQLKRARERCPGVEFHESLIEEFQTTERFDNVFMLNILEHVTDPVAVLQKGQRFLADGGRLIVHVPNAASINRRIAVLMGTLTHCEELSPYDLHVAGHRRSYTLASLVADIEKGGLKVSATGGIFLKMLSTPQIDWFLENGQWDEGGFGWGRVAAPKKDWRKAFCDACYEIGKERPEDCNIIFAVATR